MPLLPGLVFLAPHYSFPTPRIHVIFYSVSHTLFIKVFFTISFHATLQALLPPVFLTFLATHSLPSFTFSISTAFYTGFSRYGYVLSSLALLTLLILHVFLLRFLGLVRPFHTFRFFASTTFWGSTIFSACLVCSRSILSSLYAHPGCSSHSYNCFSFSRPLLLLLQLLSCHSTSALFFPFFYNVYCFVLVVLVCAPLASFAFFQGFLHVIPFAVAVCSLGGGTFVLVR